MSERDAFGWAIQAPAWASPPFFVLLDSVADTRAKAQAIVAAFHRRDGDTTVGQSWRRAYRDGWRAIRVRVTPAFVGDA